MKKYRYPGAHPFTLEQQELFFGRKEDIEKTYELINLENLVVIYSKSGLGKSSLINAGIIPRINKEQEYNPLLVRFGAHHPENNQNPTSTSRLRIRQDSAPFYLDKLVKNDQSLWSAVKYQQLQGIDNMILFFDQFEELFTYPKGAISTFSNQIAELLNRQIPTRFRNALEEQFKSEQVLLSDEELDHLHKPFTVKVVMAIRSDRMSLLNQLKKYIPNILRNCYELTPLSRQQAEDAILSPAYKKGKDYISSVFDYDEEAIEGILNFLTDKDSHKIESFQLQILCQSIEQKVVYHKLKLVTLKDIGNLENIYKNYYENQIMLLGSPEEQLAARILIEEGLIFEEEERRLSLYEGQIKKSFEVSDELINKLVDSHLIRAEPSMQGGYTYELSHDTLVGPVLKSKTKRKEAERKEEEKQVQKELEEQEQRDAAELRRQEFEQKMKLRRRIIFGAVSAVLIIATLLGNLIFVNQQKAKTEEALQEIEILYENQKELTKERAVANYQKYMIEGANNKAARQFEEAIQSYQKAIDEVAGLDLAKDSINALSKMQEIYTITEASNDFFVLVDKGDALIKKGPSFYLQARSLYVDAQDLDYDTQLTNEKLSNVDRLIENTVTEYKRKANNFLDQNYKDFAEIWLKKALRLKPNDQQAKTLLEQIN